MLIGLLWSALTHLSEGPAEFGPLSLWPRRHDRPSRRAPGAPKPEWVRHEVLRLKASTPAGGCRYWIFAVIEYRSRAVLMLAVLARKCARAIVRMLARAIATAGAPKLVVTDNQGMFRSAVFGRLLREAGIRHGRIEPFSPWQNGRIERFFGTLKRLLNDRRIASLEALQRELNVFLYWYNCVRPHQSLEGRTPFEAWALAGAGARRATWFRAWDGLLTGYALSN